MLAIYGKGAIQIHFTFYGSLPATKYVNLSYEMHVVELLFHQ